MLNVGISHNLKDWLMCLTIESEKIERAKLKDEMLVQFKLEHHSVIGS
jgi:hypothetical protein